VIANSKAEPEDAEERPGTGKDQAPFLKRKSKEIDLTTLPIRDEP
jgi:hypothetical protein